ncbi:MAG: hypothetical protein M3Q40_00270 [Pseudomonadota bacterium]|nr:hypothetical protein [Pseudomonadota bacterium]
MKKGQRIAAVLIAAISLCLIILMWWKKEIENSAIQAVSNIELSSGASLLKDKAHFTRLGSEGVRLRIYDLAPEYASQLRSNCKGRGYHEQSGRTIGIKYPFLQSYLDADDLSCVRSASGEIRGVSIIQQTRLIVFIII